MIGPAVGCTELVSDRSSTCDPVPLNSGPDCSIGLALISDGPEQEIRSRCGRSWAVRTAQEPTSVYSFSNRKSGSISENSGSLETVFESMSHSTYPALSNLGR